MAAAAERRGQVQIIFEEDPTVKRLLQIEAIKANTSLAEIMRDLLRGWLAQRGVKLKTQRITRGGTQNVVT